MTQSLIEKIFKCQQCGFCCQGETTVSLDSEDQKLMLEYLDMSLEQACRKYLRKTGNVVQMQTIDGHCVFFDNNCSAHPSRPWRCRQWPLHPSIMSDSANFEAIRTSCPGINQDISYEEFCEIFSKLPEKYWL
jgi:uncharacterized protein